MSAAHTDIGRLELAAKAAGVVIDHWRGDQPIVVVLFRGHLENYERWNPLEDDGDALRLAVKLELYVDTKNFDGVIVGWVVNGKALSTATVQEPHDGDPAYATRRAIVRAAAEIGRSLEHQSIQSTN